MPKQPSAMHNGQQDSMLNLAGSRMLRPDADKAGLARAYARGKIGTNAKSLVHTRLFAAFGNARRLSCLARKPPRARWASASGPCASQPAVNAPAGSGFRLSVPAQAHSRGSASHGSELEERCVPQYRRARSRSRIPAAPGECRQPSRAVLH